MKHILTHLTALLLALTAARTIPAAETTAPVPDNPFALAAGKASAAAVARWHEAKFGLFLHWGVYSVYGGTYHGKELWSAEWIQENARIPWAEYSQTAAEWNPAEFDADAWVRLARDAGMRYIVITAKHHDGFAMYRSRASRYNLMDWSKYRGPDPLAALKAACRKYGLLFGIYYSPLEFRTSPKGFDAEDEKAVANGFDYRTIGPQPYATNADVVRLAQAQIKELAENYRPDIFWFDGTWDKMGTWTEADGLQAERAIRAAAPDVLINNRLGIKAADFDVYENEIPATPPARVWEYCWNLGVFWGYNPRNYRPDLVKTPEHYVETLAHIASLGGNYLLNVGPDPTGRIHPMAVEYLTKIGQWARVNGECIHGAAASPFPAKPAWGYVTSRPGKLYLIVKNWQPRITLPALQRKITKAYLLAQPMAGALKFSQTEQGVTVELPGNAPDPMMTVVCLETERKE